MESNDGKMGRRRFSQLRPSSTAVLVLALLTGALPAGAGTASPAQAASSRTASTSSRADLARAVKPSTQTYPLSPERYDKAVSLVKEYLYFVSEAWGILVLLVWLRIGWSHDGGPWPNAPAASGGCRH